MINSDTDTVYIINNGWGELSFLLALQNPQIRFIGIDSDVDKTTVARYVAEKRAPNLTVIEGDIAQIQLDPTNFTTIIQIA